MANADAVKDLAEHLRLFGELGVTGISRDPAWRARTRPESPANQTIGIAGESVEEFAAPPPAAVGQSTVEQSDDVAGFVATANVTSNVTNRMPDNVPPIAGADTATALAALRAHIGVCMRCKLSTLGRHQVVFGAGNPQAKLMFVGEAPGADEDMKGEPFVGRAGQLLTKIIEAIELRREDVYIANVIKCRPPGNRNPEPDEVATCEPFLLAQIDAIKPRVIVALGTFAAHALLKVDTPISRIRGVVHEFRGGAKLIPTFHPAFLLRSPDRKRDVWDDMKKVRALLNDLG